MNPLHLITILSLLLMAQIRDIGGEDTQMRILTRAQTFQRPVGGNISLPCSVINLDGSVVTWSKDGQVISADSFKVLQDARISVRGELGGQGVSLTISGLRRSDAGQWVCALNTKTSVLSTTHTLHIEVPPTIHGLHPRNGTITVRSGSRVRLECKASGQPHPTIFWTRMHNQPFAWGHGTNMSVSGESLVMTNITRSYSGDYACNADNGVGRWPVTQLVTLNVLYAPEVDTDHSWIHCGEGRSVTLVCRVYANPVARVLWYKDTMKLIGGDRIQTEQVGDTYKLSITKVGVRDYGEYYCRASNLLDKDVSAAIVLTGCPSVPVIKGETAGDQAYSYDVIWSVESDYSLLQHEVVYWPLSSRPDVSPPATAHTRRVPAAMATSSEGEQRYTIMGLGNSTVYGLMVRSQNKFGWSPFSPVVSFHTVARPRADKKGKQGSVLDSQGPLKSEPVVSASQGIYNHWIQALELIVIIKVTVKMF